jgi:ABC-type nitrate/sulfonate/bicarbonate transport system substrate-binding protein
MSDGAPWFRESFVAVSATFARDHHDATVRFMRAVLRAMSDVRAAKGQWTPEFVASIVKWSQLPEATIRGIPGPAYPGDGQIDVASVTRQQDFWHARGLVANVVPVSSIIDFTVLHDVGTSTR